MAISNFIRYYFGDFSVCDSRLFRQYLPNPIINVSDNCFEVLLDCSTKMFLLFTCSECESISLKKSYEIRGIVANCLKLLRTQLRAIKINQRFPRNPHQVGASEHHD